MTQSTKVEEGNKTYYIKIVADGITYEHIVTNLSDLNVLKRVLKKVEGNAKKVVDNLNQSTLKQ